MRKCKMLSSLPTPWTISFANIAMLLILFFGILLSISSITKKRISPMSATLTIRNDQMNSDKEEDLNNIKEASMLLVDEKNITANKNHILELIFSKERISSNLHAEITRSPIMLRQQRQEVTFIFANNLLFTSESLLLSKSGEKLLDLVTPVIQTIEAHIAIKVGGNYSPALNVKKAMSLLEYLHNKGVQQNRLSIEVSGVSGLSQTELIIK